MTSVVYTKNYITQEQLRRAYAQLDHTPPPDNRWEATLRITPTLEMDWACRCLIEWGEEDHEGRPVADPGWHVISRAGELDWPPLRPHEEMWDAMLRRYPIPTGEEAQRHADIMGTSPEEERRRKFLALTLQDSYARGQRNPRLVDFDPVLRDWSVTARQLADFLDTHKPPKLTAEQRVMQQGAVAEELQRQADQAREGLPQLVKNAYDEQGNAPRKFFMADMARWAGTSRPTAYKWIQS